MNCDINFKNCSKIINETSNIDVIKLIYFLALTHESCNLNDYIDILSAITKRGYLDNVVEWDIMYLNLCHISNNKKLIETEK